MSKPAIATGLRSDLGALMAENEVATLPAANLQNRQLSRKWRTDGLANIALELDLGSDLAVNLVGLFGTNASGTATVRVLLADSQANLTAAPAHDELVPHWPEADLATWAETNFIHWIDPAVTARWVRLEIADTDNADGYYQAGRLYVDAAWQPSRSFQYPQGLRFNDPSPVTETAGGQEYPDERPLRRELTLNLRFISEADLMDGVFELQRRLGQTRDLFALRDPTDATHLHKRSLYGRFKSLDTLEHAAHRMFEAQLTVLELL